MLKSWSWEREGLNDESSTAFPHSTLLHEIPDVDLIFRSSTSPSSLLTQREKLSTFFKLSPPSNNGCFTMQEYLPLPSTDISLSEFECIMPWDSAFVNCIWRLFSTSCSFCSTGQAKDDSNVFCMLISCVLCSNNLVSKSYANSRPSGKCKELFSKGIWIKQLNYNI